MQNKPMQKKTFHGPVNPSDFADALVAEFNQGNLEAKRIGRGNQRIVQIATPRWNTSGGRTAITIHLNGVEDGVHVQLGQQEWFGIAGQLRSDGSHGSKKSMGIDTSFGRPRPGHHFYAAHNPHLANDYANR